MTIHIFFDIDGTLTTDISSWKKVHDSIGSREEAKANHKQWLEDQDARNWVDNDLKILNSRGVTPADVRSILDMENIQYMHGAKEFIRNLQNHINLNMLPTLIEIHLISGAIYPYAQAVANDLYIDTKYRHFHRLYYEDTWNEYQKINVWKHDKTATFKDKGEIIERYKDRLNTVIAIGNGTNDIDMFKKADISVGLNIRKSDRNQILPHLDLVFLNQDGVFPPRLMNFLMGVIDRI